MALLINAIPPRGSHIEAVFPQHGKTFTLAELQEFVGGYIECLQMEDGHLMFLNEDGKAMGLPVNLIADILAHKLARVPHWDHIVGNVIIATREECNEPEEGQAA